MEECESLCSRIGIMAGGRLQCIGTNQHLKNKWVIKCRLHVLISITQIRSWLFVNTETSIDWSYSMRMRTSWTTITKCSSWSYSLYNNLLSSTWTLSIVTRLSCYQWSIYWLYKYYQLDDKWFQIQKRFGFEDCSLSQTTLDEVFVSFASSSDNLPSSTMAQSMSPVTNDRELVFSVHLPDGEYYLLSRGYNRNDIR